MKMVTTKKAQEMLAERGIEVSYPTLAQWTREGKFEGAEREETERGPVWRIPLDSIKKFQPPPMGRPPGKSSTAKKAATAKATASNGASVKKKGKK
jgi:hypothetical protein